jgi:hypothetical protein
VYESGGHYRSIPADDVFWAVFLPLLEGLHGVTDDQVARSFAAVARLEQRAEK